MTDTPQAHSLEELFPRFPEVERFRETLTPESDRGCALIAAALLDDTVAAGVRSCLVDDDRCLGRLFRPDGPLGSFSARIDLLFLLGAIGDTPRKDLHLIRKIRNEFAHNSDPIGFDHQPIAQRCEELSYSDRLPGTSPRRHFTAAVCGVLAVLHVAESVAVRPKRAVSRVAQLDEEEFRRLSAFISERLNAEFPADGDPEKVRQAKRTVLKELLETELAPNEME